MSVPAREQVASGGRTAPGVRFTYVVHHFLSHGPTRFEAEVKALRDDTLDHWYSVPLALHADTPDEAQEQTEAFVRSLADLVELATR